MYRCSNGTNFVVIRCRVLFLVVVSLNVKFLYHSNRFLRAALPIPSKFACARGFGAVNETEVLPVGKMRSSRRQSSARINFEYPVLVRSLSFTRFSASGFTLIELLIGITILGVLAALAVPSFSESIKSQRIKVIRDDLVASLELARVEAIRRGVSVGLVREPVSTNCVVSLTSDDKWSCGWKIVVDADANGAISDAEQAASVNVLKTTTVPAGYDMTHPNLGKQIVFGVWGQAVVAGQNFVIANTRDGISGDSTLKVCLGSAGKIRTVKVGVSCP